MLFYRFSQELANGLAFLHTHGLVHLDVKPANVLLTHQFRLKLSDFGCCTQVNRIGNPVCVVISDVGYFPIVDISLASKSDSYVLPNETAK